ncbi:MAG TPA: acetoacetate--CoA ligase, partial [Rhizobiales bacterium]|nr:acetoacetate--CoA ligase [Hyphomicrobiales bacterium]
WAAIWDYSGVRAQTRGDVIIEDGNKVPGAKFFPGARLNYAENLLVKSDDTPALIFQGEDKVSKTVTWRQFNDEVSRLHQAFRQFGLEESDRVCAIVPNLPETIMTFAGAASLGAIWSSCSPDFGEKGILDRFGQIEPRVLVVCDGYYYNGKTIDIGEKVEKVVAQLPSLELVVVIDYIGRASALARRLELGVELSDFAGAFEAGPVDFAQLPFDHPLYILFSSGTTGIPKCIVHKAGGVLLKHLSEQKLQGNVSENDKLFYFTTCGWMMWNWLVSGLASGATLLLYDGSPFYPDERVLFDYADREKMTIFGTSAKFIDAVRKTGWRPCETHDLSSVQAMLSTGSPLAPESFEFVYDAIKPDIHLASVSGGTDLCGCFVGGDPTGPVWKGEIQAVSPGMDVAVFDDDGKPLERGKGELVCRNAFPSMPLGFWNDPDDEKYLAAYYSRFEGVWCHGDFAEFTEHGGMIIHGRSDATLNPGGVRIGTAEIYAQVEQIEEVIEGLAIGQQWGNDTRVVLFVRLKEGVQLDEELEKRIRLKIRTGASPRHVPARIVAVSDIPRTKSGKITELAVRDVVHGREVKNKEALANPEALDLFRDIPALQQ